MDVKIRGLNINILEKSFQVSGLEVRDINNKDNKLIINSLSINFNPIESILKKTISIESIKSQGVYVLLENHKNDGDDDFFGIMKHFLNKDQKPLFADNKISTKSLIRTFKQGIQELNKTIPKELNIENFRLKIGSEENNDYHSINITGFKIMRKSPKHAFCLIKMKDSVSSYGALTIPISLRKLKLKAELSEDNISISELSIFSNYIELTSRGEIGLNEKLKGNLLSATVNAKLNAKEAFSLIDMDAKGHFKLQGQFSSKNFEPDNYEFNGMSEWVNLNLMLLDFYSGTFNVNYKNKSVAYNKLLFSLPDGGTLEGHGRYELFDEFFFENNLRVNNITLQQVFKMIDLDIIRLDSVNSSKKLEVNGHFNKYDTEYAFDMKVKAYMISESFQIPLNDKFLNPMTFSPIETQTDMRITKDFLSFNNTKLKFNEGEVLTDDMLISFDTKKIPSRFYLDLKNIDVNLMTYALKTPYSGTLNSSVSMFITDTRGFELFCNPHIDNLKAYSLKFAKVKSDFYLNEDYLRVKNSFFYLNKDENTHLYLDEFKLFFETLRFKFASRANQFQVNDFLDIQNLNKSFNLLAQVNKLKLSAQGSFEKLLETSINLELNADNNETQFNEFDFKSINALLSCNKGVCENSSLNIAYEKYLKKGTLNLNLQKFSENHSNFKIKTNNFDITLLASLVNKKIGGYLNSDLSFRGRWEALKAKGTTEIKNFSYNNVNIESLKIDPSATSETHYNFVTHISNSDLPNKYITLNFKALQKDLSDLTLEANIQNFDVLSFFDESFTENYGQKSSIQGKVSFYNPRAFTTRDFSRWLLSSSFHSSLSINHLNYAGLPVYSKDPLIIKKVKNKIILPQTTFFNDGGSLSFFGEYDLKTQNIKFNSHGSSALSKLAGYFDGLGQCDGSAIGKLDITGRLDNYAIKGFLNVDSKIFTVNEALPAFTQLKLQTTFDNDTIFVKKFSGGKEPDGSFNLKGKIILGNFLKQIKKYPEIHLQGTFNNIRNSFRTYLIPIIDTQASGKISISGDSPPYFIEGDVNLGKFLVFKDGDCASILNQFFGTPNIETSIIEKPLLFDFDLKLKTIHPISIQSQCLDGNFVFEPELHVTGNNITQSLNGNFVSTTARLNLLKSTFNIQRFTLNFDANNIYNSPIDLSLLSQIQDYTIIGSLTGKLGSPIPYFYTKPGKLENGDNVSESDIMVMISTGNVPLQTTQNDPIYAGFTTVSLFSAREGQYGENLISRLTKGNITNISFEPYYTNRLGVKVKYSRTFLNRFNLGVGFTQEGGEVESLDPNAYFRWNLSRNINMLFSLQKSEESSDVTDAKVNNDIFMGLRFQFSGDQ